MNVPQGPAVLEALEWLIEANREELRPAAALERLGALRDRCPDVRIELVWEEGAFDGAVHYDALLRPPEGGTVSLSFCPARALPWPLRGVHRWSEADLVRVNDQPLKVDQAIACLDFIWDEGRLADSLVNFCLVREALEREPEAVSDEELQAGMDSLRRSRGLHSAAETRRWMERNGITHEKLESFAAGQARVARLRERMTASEVEAAFAARHAEYDRARIARFNVPDEADAERLAQQIRAGELEFYAAAEARFRENSQPGARALFEEVRRGQAGPLAEPVFAAASGEVVGPVRTDRGWALARVLSFTPATLDARTRRAIQDELFGAWLAERRQEARIEWCWGRAAPASASG